VEMIVRAINFLSTILVATGLAGCGAKTGAAIAELAPTDAGVLLGASGRSPATENGASKTTAKAARAIQFKDAPWHGSTGKRRPAGGRVLAASDAAGYVHGERVYSASLPEHNCQSVIGS
jgi:hypothetical protein